MKYYIKSFSSQYWKYINEKIIFKMCYDHYNQSIFFKYSEFFFKESNLHTV